MLLLRLMMASGLCRCCSGVMLVWFCLLSFYGWWGNSHIDLEGWSFATANQHFTFHVCDKFKCYMACNLQWIWKPMLDWNLYHLCYTVRAETGPHFVSTLWSIVVAPGCQVRRCCLRGSFHTCPELRNAVCGRRAECAGMGAQGNTGSHINYVSMVCVRELLEVQNIPCYQYRKMKCMIACEC